MRRRVEALRRRSPGRLDMPMILCLLCLVSLAAAGDSAARECASDYAWIPAWEIARETDGGEHEIFVDERGTQLFEVFKSKEDQREEAAELADLPVELRVFVDCLLEGRIPLRVQREVEWGHRVLAVKWRGVEGVQEIKALEDGTLLFLELPPGGALPKEVAAKGASRSDVEALYLFLSPPVLEQMQSAVAEPKFQSLFHQKPRSRP